jgi:Protein of unknown function (DUF1064)
MEQAFAKSHSLHQPHHKTGAQCPRCAGPVRVFDSQAEFTRARELKLLEAAGEVSELAYQVKYPLTVNEQHLCFYIADFTYTDKDGTFVVEDVKNKAMAVTELALHKMRHFELEYGFEVSVVGR